MPQRTTPSAGEADRLGSRDPWLLAIALAVVIGVGLTAGLMVERLVLEPSMRRAAALQLHETACILKEYKVLNGRYPHDLAAMEQTPSLRNDAEAATSLGAVRPLFDADLRDPWGGRIGYRPAPKPALISRGPDGRPSGDDIIVLVDDIYDPLTPITTEEVR